MTVMATLLFLLLLTLFLGALGRSATPRTERLPWWTWTLRDLTANVVRGGRVLVELNQRQRHLGDRYLDEFPTLAPHVRRQRTPGQHDDDRC